MGSKMGKKEKAVFLEEAEGKRASSKVSLSKMILRMVGILLGILAVGITVSAFLSGYIRKQAEAVSYTHLDVYKRQGCEVAGRRLGGQAFLCLQLF